MTRYIVRLVTHQVKEFTVIAETQGEAERLVQDGREPEYEYDRDVVDVEVVEICRWES